MTTQNNSIMALDLKELLDHKDEYTIPIYQRNYAWETKEISQLIQDIIDFSVDYPNKNYYIGTLVVAMEGSNANFKTIDGQQRLTTLNILSSVIKNNYKQIDMSWFTQLNLNYESREKSSLSMNAVFEGVFTVDNYEINIIF